MRTASASTRFGLIGWLVKIWETRRCQFLRRCRLGWFSDRSLGNLRGYNGREHNGFGASQIVQPATNPLSPRLQFAHPTPATVRVQSGRAMRANLQVVSVTGGLLCLPSPLDQGSQVKLMFLTDAGMVLGTSRMLD